MSWYTCLLFASVGAFALTGSRASAATATPQQKTFDAFVGTWNCITKSGGKTYRERDVYTLWGPWLKWTGSYPAQQGEPAGTNVGFTGYDAKQSRWVLSYVDSQGGYGSAYSDSKAFVGSVWVTGDAPDSGSRTVKSFTAKKLVTDSTGKDARGKPITYHQVCTRT